MTEQIKLDEGQTSPTSGLRGPPSTSDRLGAIPIVSEGAGGTSPTSGLRGPPSTSDRLGAIPIVSEGAGGTSPTDGSILRRVFIKTWGCQMNEYDSGKMADILHHHYRTELVSDPEQADIILMNTCSVREKAQEKVFSELGQWRKIKASKPNLILGVGGCVASQEGELLRRRAPWVDIVFGPQTLHRLPKLIDEVRRKKRAVVDISFPLVEKFDELVPGYERNGISAFVSIMEGCSKYCSFCVVPYTRGREVSRDWSGIVAEIVELAKRGVREVTLLGQNVNAWVGEDNESRPLDFAWLLKVIDAIDGIDRIRYTTSHPIEMNRNLIQLHGESKSLMPYLHLPVQSGSDRVLMAMKRGYSALEYKAIIRRLRRACPEISLSSDFIVAFPGETENDHRATLELIEEVGFDHSYSFIYSARPGTPAASLPQQIDKQIAKRRLREMQSLLKEQSRRSRSALVGREVELLLEERPKAKARETTSLRGRTPCNRVVRVQYDSRLCGALVEARISEMATEALVAEVVGVISLPSVKIA